MTRDRNSRADRGWRSLRADAAQLKRIRLPDFDKVRGQVTEFGRSCEDARGHMVRESWLETVVRELQIAAGRLSVADPESLERFLPTVVDTIPHPDTQIECVVLRGLLGDFAHRGSAAAHAKRHDGSVNECTFLTRTAAFSAPWSCDDPRIGYTRWCQTFLTDLDRVHPPTLAQRGSRLIKAHYTEQLGVPAYARELGVTPSQLLRAFRRHFQMSVSEYLNAVRVAAALERLPHEKVDAVARQVGWHSTKNLLKAVHRATGLTPTAFRALAPADASALISQAKKKTDAWTVIRLRSLECLAALACSGGASLILM